MGYVEHPLFTDPKDTDKIWRYINFEKFQSLLDTQSLFFCRADVFIDPFEGSLPKTEFEYRQATYRKLMEKSGDDPDSDIGQAMVDALSLFNRKLTSISVINCWHHNETESDAMWQLYLKDNRGVAIRSTCDRLKSALSESEHEIHIGKVRYIDYENGIFFDKKEFPHLEYNTYTPFIHKRNHFAHEKEYRAITEVEHEQFVHDWESEENEKGIFIPVKIDELIEAVILPPKANEDIKREVESIVKENGFDFTIIHSKMSDEPYF